VHHLLDVRALGRATTDRTNTDEADLHLPSTPSSDVIFGFAPLTLALAILAVLVVVSAVIVAVGIRVANHHQRDAVDFRDVMLGRTPNARSVRASTAIENQPLVAQDGGDSRALTDIIDRLEKHVGRLERPTGS
jgi:hypothetical protein